MSALLCGLVDGMQVGEAPEEVRAVMRQRSRWCKGHMQVWLHMPCDYFNGNDESTAE